MLALPRAHVGQMIGLLEVLEDFKGRVDVAKVADDLILELDDLLPAVDAAELLTFIKVDSGDLILTETGREFLSKGPKARKKLLNKYVANLDSFKKIINFIRNQENYEVSKEELLDLLKGEVADFDAESDFSWIIEWGRNSLLLKYDSDDDKIHA
ncbi:AAA-associated domain-containing protein [Thermoproteota archaeon]